MSVLFDTNVLISYLLSNTQDRIIDSIIESAYEQKFTLLLPTDVISEFNKKLFEKPYLASHISKPLALEFIDALPSIAETIPPITESIPDVSSDKKDDYLFACGAVGKAEYLVTGDKKLRKLQNVGDMRIVSPAEFYEILKKYE